MTAHRDVSNRQDRHDGILQRLPGRVLLADLREVARSKSGRTQILVHATLAFLLGATAALIFHGDRLGF